jgi:hypothetical protein
MLKLISLTLFVLSALVLVGCSQSANNSNNAAANANRPATTSTPAMTMSPASTTAGAKIGVPECDDFIAKYDACVSGHVPQAARAQYKASLDTWRSQWQKLAANPQTKPTLAKACKTIAEQQQTAMKSFKCTL